MSRFILSPGAGDDLVDLAEYLRGLPAVPARRIGKALQFALKNLAQHPGHGHRHADYCEFSGEEIRSFVVGDYVLLYASQRKPITFVGVIHGKRDSDAIMRQRLG